MSTKKFSIMITFRNSLDHRGRLDDYIKSQMVLYDMDPNKPYSIVDDDEKRVTIIEQETGDEQKTKEHQDNPF